MYILEAKTKVSTYLFSADSIKGILINDNAVYQEEKITFLSDIKGVRGWWKPKK